MQWVNINIKIAYVPMAIIVCKPVGSKLSRHRIKFEKHPCKNT